MYKNLNKKIVATVEARMTSSRLPGKVLMPLAGKPALERLIERLKLSSYLDEIVVATTINKADDPIVELAGRLGVKYFRGSESDVLGRVLGAARFVGADIIVEITGDCPLVDPYLVNRGIEEFFSREVDYASNIISLSYPIGFDVQVFPADVLAEVDSLTQDPIDRTHVSWYVYNHPERYRLHNWVAETGCFWPDLRLTLDEKGDYELLNKIFESFVDKEICFGAKEIIQFLRDNQTLLEINKNVRQKTAKEG